jgi:hypothetical protein
MKDGEYVDYVLTKASRKYLTLAASDLRAALELVLSSPPNRIERSAPAPVFVERAQPARPAWQSYRQIDNSKLREMQHEYAEWEKAAKPRRAVLTDSVRSWRQTLEGVAADSALAEEARRETNAIRPPYRSAR